MASGLLGSWPLLVHMLQQVRVSGQLVPADWLSTDDIHYCCMWYAEGAPHLLEAFSSWVHIQEA